MTDAAVLHLFPLPATATATTALLNSNTNTISGAPNPLLDTNPTSAYNLSYSRAQLNRHIPGIPQHMMRPLHFVPEVLQSIREVKMWCYILIITSTMDIFTNLSFLGSQGD
jgi:hypothetical protein